MFSMRRVGGAADLVENPGLAGDTDEDGLPDGRRIVNGPTRPEWVADVAHRGKALGADSRSGPGDLDHLDHPAVHGCGQAGHVLPRERLGAQRGRAAHGCDRGSRPRARRRSGSRWFGATNRTTIAESWSDFGLGLHPLGTGKGGADGTWGRDALPWDNERGSYATAYNHRWGYKPSDARPGAWFGAAAMDYI